jgi:hypothetical protein
VRYAILGSFARTLVAEAYASFCESEQQEDRPTDDLDMPGAGEDWLDFAPEPTPEAVAIAAQAITRIEQHVGMSVEALYEHCSGACAVSVRRCQRSTHSPEHFGSDLAMQYVGTGVAWSDDHATSLDLPHGESGLYSRADFGLPEPECGESGYTACPCCGYDTISSDMSKPELCSDCIEAQCDADGSEPRCDCGED